MSRKLDEATVSRHLEIYAEDWEFLLEHFGRHSEAKLGVSTAIRQMIRKGVRDYRERVARRLDALRGAPQAPSGPLPSLDKFFVNTTTQQEDDAC